MSLIVMMIVFRYFDQFIDDIVNSGVHNKVHNNIINQSTYEAQCHNKQLGLKLNLLPVQGGANVIIWQSKV